MEHEYLVLVIDRTTNFCKMRNYISLLNLDKWVAEAKVFIANSRNKNPSHKYEICIANYHVRSIQGSQTPMAIKMIRGEQ